MTHPGKLAAFSNQAERPHGGDGLVLRGVVMDSQMRALVRPARMRHDAAIAAPAQTPAQVTPSEAAVDSEPAHRRAIQSGYEEGLRKGYSEGKIQGEAVGREEGVLAGLEQGRLSARQEASDSEEYLRVAKQAIAERLGRLDALLQALPAELDKRILDADDELLVLSYEVAARILGDAAASQIGVRSILSQAVAGAKLKAAATVHVNPRDMAFLEADQELAALIGTHVRVQWRADAAVELGGCLISTPEGSLDARLETQMAELAQVFSSARKERGR